MGRRPHHPRRGSLAYMPRVRAPRPVAHVRAWPADAILRLQGFVGYKAGMTHVFMIDDRKGSLTAGQEIVMPATVIDVPPLVVCSIKMYGQTTRGFNTLTEVWSSELSKDLARVLVVPEKYDQQKALSEAEALVKDGKVAEVRLLLHTQPRLSGVPKKKPDLVEISVGGPSIGERWNRSKELLGKQIKVTDVFKEGEFVDVSAITKGKGFQGPVKRWGIKILPRKQDDGARQVGTLGPWKPPRVMWTVPGPGQMGYNQRTDINKRILKLGAKGEEVTPSGGFMRYGPVKGDYVLLAGSIPGPAKRLVHLRRAMKGPAQIAPPSVTSISIVSQQGV
ncbi:MAG: 50S ribosomal protein L3 [Hadesarchaea archaeon CG08_land_8_20_14_0_20_51_8]|nr:MAG: 50S ribosomal protein L3 [Hadesarchaea archaeon CG08_land_8_20_14_0_20_51_8]